MAATDRVFDRSLLSGWLSASRPPLTGRRAEPAVTAVHCHPGHGRLRAEAFLESAYARSFRARLGSHYPILMSAENADGEVAAVVGFRFAGDGPLFLEAYLDAPVEAAIETVLGERADRARIVEIGGLASADPKLSPRLFAALGELLFERGYTHAVATVTRRLRRRFARIGFGTRVLAPAQQSRLSDDRSDWGAYYNQEPEVLVGIIGAALPALRRILGSDGAA